VSGYFNSKKQTMVSELRKSSIIHFELLSSGILYISHYFKMDHSVSETESPPILRWGVPVRLGSLKGSYPVCWSLFNGSNWIGVLYLRTEAGDTIETCVILEYCTIDKSPERKGHQACFCETSSFGRVSWLEPITCRRRTTGYYDLHLKETGWTEKDCVPLLHLGIQ
jgi:hypothetical protein